MARILYLTFHAGLLYLCGYFHFFRTESLQTMYDKGVIKQTFGGSSRFLTIWGQYLTIFYVLFSCINDIVHILDLKLKTRMLLFMNHIFYPICTMTTIIGILFWSIYYVDKDLMIPKKMRPFYPMILNVFQHGGNGLILWIDAICFGQKRVYRKTIHHFTSFVFAMIYQIWSLICAAINGFHAYPFLNTFYLYQHIIFFGGVIFIGFCVQSVIIFIIEKLHHHKDDKKIK